MDKSKEVLGVVLKICMLAMQLLKSSAGSIFKDHLRSEKCQAFAAVAAPQPYGASSGENYRNKICGKEQSHVSSANIASEDFDPP